MVRPVFERLIAAVVLLFAGLVPAHAADRAQLELIGFSEDGRLFAFEEYGIQDGSGFAFSTIFVIDLVADRWVTGSPYRQQAEDEAASLAEIRAAARALARPALEADRIAVPAQILALVGDGAGPDGGLTLEWSTPACCGAAAVQDDRFTLSLSTAAIGSPDDYCAEMNPVGFSLELEAEGARQRLHQDMGTLPRSRGCTLDYRIHAVVQPFADAGPLGLTQRRVALISSYPFGFEGVDRRFLAVPIDR